MHRAVCECEIHGPQYLVQRVEPRSYGTVQYQVAGHKIPSLLCCKMEGSIGMAKWSLGQKQLKQEKGFTDISQPLVFRQSS